MNLSSLDQSEPIEVGDAHREAVRTVATGIRRDRHRRATLLRVALVSTCALVLIAGIVLLSGSRDHSSDSAGFQASTTSAITIEVSPTTIAPEGRELSVRLGNGSAAEVAIPEGLYIDSMNETSAWTPRFLYFLGSGAEPITPIDATSSGLSDGAYLLPPDAGQDIRLALPALDAGTYRVRIPSSTESGSETSAEFVVQ